MTGRIIRHCTRDVLGIDTSDDPYQRLAPVPEPSLDLLDRARVGWERFLRTTGEASGE
ncbi:hypothetical protein ACIPW5_36920 [Streptomyces sp. NPDC090077]|uniref:hypothetical protein n=1 Tax=Streptomyces sp. NPDC090077 TaxID=3365938 RepID=UPI00382E46DC